ncbi:MAG TPA: hypothetical protein VGX21_17865, partial [Methylomirabilota bacterium]|nr:hypothetical protein [Methylomirabilota bacterium]
VGGNGPELVEDVGDARRVASFFDALERRRLAVLRLRIHAMDLDGEAGLRVDVLAHPDDDVLPGLPAATGEPGAAQEREIRRPVTTKACGHSTPRVPGWDTVLAGEYL